MEIAVVVWLLASVLVAVFAGTKGRSVVGAFLASILLSPLIGLIVVAASKSKGQLDESAARRGRSRTHRPCPKCAEIIRREATKCPQCGEALTPEPYPRRTLWQALNSRI